MKRIAQITLSLLSLMSVHAYTFDKRNQTSPGGNYTSPGGNQTSSGGKSSLGGNQASFGGSSLYLLHGLSASDQATYIDTIASWGAKVIRVWVTGTGAGCQKGFNVSQNIPELEPTTIGTYDDTVLEALDSVLAQFVQKGIKAIVSPHDGNAFGYNSCDVYCEAYGDGGDNDASATTFYQNTTAISQYDARMNHILEYVSPSSGIQWGQWSDAIFAFDIENEPFDQAYALAQQNDPSDWLCGRAQAMRASMGNSAVQLATGGIGGDQSSNNTFMPRAIECSDIDIVSLHVYVSTSSFWSSYLSGNLGQVEQNNKLMMVEEWGVETSYADQFDSQVASINSQGIPWSYWQFTFYDQTSCLGSCCSGSWDGYEIGFNSSKGNISTALQAAASTAAKQNFSPYIS